MDNYVHTEEYRGINISIAVDDSPESPREWDNLGTMVCFHNHYNLGDKHEFSNKDYWDEKKQEYVDVNSWKDVLRQIEAIEGKIIALPLYLYDHGGITMRTGEFSDPWDSGQVGFIYVSRKKIREEFGAKKAGSKLIAKAKEILEREVKTYADYLEGNVYGFVVDDEGEMIDSCWGYFGDYDGDVLDDARSVVDHYIKQKNRTRLEKLKDLIKNNVPLSKRVQILAML